MSRSTKILQATRRLCNELEPLSFAAPITHIYNPLIYARKPHETYIKRYADSKKRVLLMGMNPGPFGMAQTGVPFGEVTLVRDWLDIDAPVDKPDNEHPKRPVQGFACPKSEVSGRRLWGTIAEHFTTPNAFFKDHFVANYCPLVFMEESSRNRTPDKLPAAEKDPLFAACDRALLGLIKALEPQWVIGIGAFVEARIMAACKTLLDNDALQIGRILHPSPASPLANKDWAGTAKKQLCKLGVCL
ncbi:MAG: single-strand selective monofunctional uracil-DNA glycosylase [Deltaproteobacteria bacterium]|nr:single-strand selective monofunctional uracil-DNA glycosylase [Deltaproteobacteria bacterium]